ncbi:MAG: hypothetical protein JJU20_05030 [Opitutales bacterium]|nr:hypothetical protein [Opitutales bacterium]
MKLKNILQLTACLLVTCGLVRAAEWIDPGFLDTSIDEITQIDQSISCALPCGNGQGR